MTDRQLENTLRNAVEHAAIDDVDAVLSRCREQNGKEHTMNNNKKKFRAAPWLAAACLALLVAGGALVQQANAVASVISLDVNPSIELRVNRNEKVLSCTALNQDAQVILGDMTLEGTQLDVAVNAIIGSLVQNGYLDSLSSAILISVEDKDTQRGSRIQENLTSQVDTALQSASAGAAILSQVVEQNSALEKQAQQSSISVGKAALIQRVQSLNSSLPFDDLAELSVEELKDLAESGAPGLPIGKDAAVAAAKQYAGLSDEMILHTETDSELDERTPHYEVELYTTNSGEFDYEIAAYTGEVLRGKANVTASSPLVDTSTPSTPTAPSTSTEIPSEDIAAIALKDAGVALANVVGLQVKPDRDDGRLHYDVKFRSAGVEYEYEISTDGTILERNRDVDDDWTPASNTASALIDASAAKAAALTHAGVSANDVSFIKCELDEDDGRSCYEIEFQSGRTEYEYKIDAATGAILSAEKDIDD